MRRPAPFALLLALSGVALAAPRGYVELRDGRKWQDVEYEIKGNRLFVKFKSGAMTDVPMADVVIARAEGPQGGGPAPATTDAADAPSAVDGSARFKLEPPEGWEPIASPSPLLRVLLKHHQRDATLGVYVRRAAPIDLSGGAEPPTEVLEDVRNDFASRYASTSGGEARITRLHGSSVLRVEGGAKEHGSEVERKVTEVRFRRFGLEYVVCYSVAPADEGALAHQLDALLEAFSFLPAFQATPGRYADYGRGFGVTRPNPDWQLRALPFDEEQPVRLVTKDGRAEVTFQLQASTDAEAVVRGILTKRQQGSRHFTGTPVQDVARGASTVKQFRFEDFNPGGRKKLLFKGFGAALSGRVLIVTGVLPVADEDAKKLEGEVDSILASIQLFDEEGLRAQVGAAQNAATLIKQGAEAAGSMRYDEAIAKYEEALKLWPGYARAYYLRGLARQGKQDYRGYREDLIKAAQLDPTASHDAELNDSFEKEAELAEQNHQLAEAVKLRIKVWKSKKDADRLAKVLLTCGSWWEELKTGDLEKGLAQVEAQLKGVPDPTVSEFLFRVYMEGAQTLATTSASKAKKWANNARKAAATPEQKAQVDQLLEQLKQTGG